MASYFDLPPQQKAGAANIEAMPENQRKQLGRMSMLSPAVTQILDDWEDEHSDSDSEEGSLSEQEDIKHLDELTKGGNPPKTRHDKELYTQKSTKSSLSPKREERSPARGSAHVRLSPARAGGGSTKQKQPHMARFHSLRSMLFSNTIENKMKGGTGEDCEKEREAANKWKSQHEQRQMHSRPKTPEQDAQGKGHGLGSRLKTSIRRMTSKEVPTMDTLKEDGGARDFSDHGSTASSDNEPEPYQWKPREADEESIDHSGDEDLERWVSRRDPPSDGEARASKATPAITLTKADSGHDSLGESDVEDLLRWASRRRSSEPKAQEEHHTGYSDASTESDSEMAKEADSSEDEDADDLVRWVSHRDGPIAGPVRQKRGSGSNTSQTSSPLNYDSDVPELGRWVTRHDGTSGESVATSPAHDTLEEPERGRPLSREGHARSKPRDHITNDDINDIVNMLSRKNTEQRSPGPKDSAVDDLQHQEEAKKQQLGMTVDEGSLSHSDLTNLVTHVRTLTDEDVQGEEPTVQISSKPSEPETGDFREFHNSKDENRNPAAQNHLAAQRGETMPVEHYDGDVNNTEERESLTDGDILDLLKGIRRSPSG
jgi:hypothetical protein